MQADKLIKKFFLRSALVEECLSRANSRLELSVSQLSGAASAFLIDELALRLKQTVFVLVPTDSAAQTLFGDLKEIGGGNRVSYFPPWGIHPYDWLTPAPESISQRIETLWKLRRGDASIVVSSPEALRQKTMTRQELLKRCFELCLETEIDLEAVARRLVEIGYERCSTTEEVGTFSVRGGIIDIFPYTTTNPVRLELFGELVESMRYFSVLSQRSVEHTDHVAITPRREITVDSQKTELALERLDAESARTLRGKCLGGFGYPGLEWVAQLLDHEQGFLPDHLPQDTLFYLIDTEMSDDEFARHDVASEELYQEIRQHLPAAPKPESIFLSRDEFHNYLKDRQVIRELSFGSGQTSISFQMKDHPAFNGQVQLLRSALEEYRQQRQTVIITSDNELQRTRLEELLPEFSDFVHFAVSDISKGFIFPEIDLVVLTDHQIFDRHFVRYRRRRFKEGVAIPSYKALEIGDYVVHVDYGIGRYRGLEAIKIDNRRRDCLRIHYADDAKLYVPIEEFSRVQKYVGKEGKPAVTKLGGKSWEKIKARTKKAIADMAEELISLYAIRKSRPGFAFAADDQWMNHLEASFPYEETPDQLTAIAAIKRDMETLTPMDRLICGDVGFGKTEVAIRAALKAVASSKQVAVLVPTTILAQQHLTTFKKRLEQFPIRVEMLSRFKSRAEQKEIVADLENGKVDVVIGTHRLLQRDVSIRNLGLVVIDEEQRFGVAHKEKLKKLRETVDCLVLTATPIPRSLQMSLLGVREMSLIGTSPKDRLAIVTEITEFDPRIIYEAVNEEVARKGQVYFVHNRVQSILPMYRYLSKLLKHVRITVAHGQMHEHELEEVMLGFLNRDYDMLLTTSIIESGIDIPSVNTIVINRADRFGLSQLYQLRGRVGRSQERAYAYLLVPPIRLLSDVARKRLKAIEQHTELGSGFHLAMKDLEIRGAGNLLGPQQHGFIEEVGFELYCSLLEEAVGDIKGQKKVEIPDVRLEFDTDVYIPEEYIEESSQRVEIYRKISEARSESDLESIREELRDRYGAFAEEVENLLDMMAIKLLAASRGVARMKLKGPNLTICFQDGHLPGKKNIEKFRLAAPDRIEFDATGPFTIRLSFGEAIPRPVGEVKKLLQLL